MLYRKTESLFEKHVSTPETDGRRLRLVGRGEAEERGGTRAWPELASISARRCSAFFAEAAVLVLVFGVLDFFMQHGHVDGGWVLGAFSISVALLAASVATEFTARRWLGAQP